MARALVAEVEARRAANAKLIEAEGAGGARAALSLCTALAAICADA